MTNKCRSSRQRGQTRKIQADAAGARHFACRRLIRKTKKKLDEEKKTLKFFVSPLAPPTAAPSEEGRTSPSEERQQSRLLSEPRRMHRHRACVVFERRKGREEGDGTLSRRNRNGVAVDNTGGRRPHLGGRIQTLEKSSHLPDARASEDTAPFSTHQGWLGSKPAPLSCLQVDISIQQSLSPLLPSVSFGWRKKTDPLSSLSLPSRGLSRPRAPASVAAAT